MEEEGQGWMDSPQFFGSAQKCKFCKFFDPRVKFSQFSSLGPIMKTQGFRWYSKVALGCLQRASGGRDKEFLKVSVANFLGIFNTFCSGDRQGFEVAAINFRGKGVGYQQGATVLGGISSVDVRKKKCARRQEVFPWRMFVGGLRSVVRIQGKPEDRN